MRSAPQPTAPLARPPAASPPPAPRKQTASVPAEVLVAPSVPPPSSPSKKMMEALGRPVPPVAVVVPPSSRSEEALQAASEAPPETVPQIEVGTVAPRWRRFLAWMIDGTLIGAVFIALLWVAAKVVRHGPPSRQDGLDWAAETVLAYSRLLVPAAALLALLVLLYLALFTVLGGQTPGKYQLGIRVIDCNGHRPSPGRAVLRALLVLGSGALMLMGFALVFFDRRRQALHDKLAGTFVVLRV